MRQADEAASNTETGVPTLNAQRVALIESEGLRVQNLDPLGFEIHGADVRTRLSAPVIAAIEEEMAYRGFVVFNGQNDLSATELVNASKWWGGK